MITSTSDWTVGMAKALKKFSLGERGHARQARCRVLPSVVTCSPPMCFSVRHVSFRCVLLSVHPVLLSVTSCASVQPAFHRVLLVDGLPSVASWSLVGCLPSRFAAVRRVVVAWESEDKREMVNECVWGGFDERRRGGSGVEKQKKMRRENFCSST